ncbi:MAG: alpha/beta fold hydrolase [Actinomycetota bacterium]
MRDAALAYHDEHPGHSCPLPPPRAAHHFHPRFVPPWDAETRTDAFQELCGSGPWRVAGFGGARFRPLPGEPAIPARCGTGRVPIVFVHGNAVDAGDWYPALGAVADLGYTMCDLWGLSFNGIGANGAGAALHTRNPLAQEERGADGNTNRTTDHGFNEPDLAAFADAILEFTGARHFSLVGHSLGVTLARKVLRDRPDLLRRLDAFVGIAGGNRGTTVCRGNEATLLLAPERAYFGCEQLAPDLPPLWENRWLARLNEGDETPGKARYMTVYDGSGLGDPFFAGPDAMSPRLDGALNCSFAGAYHNDLRVDPVITGFYAAFLARGPLPSVAPGDSPATPQGVECDGPSYPDSRGGFAGLL